MQDIDQPDLADRSGSLYRFAEVRKMALALPLSLVNNCHVLQGITGGAKQ
jgi:hypothetical protein